MASRPNNHQFFLPGSGISREVLQAEITRYLGGDATSRPGYSSEGEPGFIITALRDFTAAQLHDIRAASAAFEAERSRRSQQGVATNYSGSATQRSLHHSTSQSAPPAVPAGYVLDQYGRYVQAGHYGASSAYPPTGGEHYRTDARPRYPEDTSGRSGYQSGGYRPVTEQQPREYGGSYSGAPPYPQGQGPSGYGAPPTSGTSGGGPPPSLPPGYYWDPNLQRAIPYPT